MSPSLTLTLRSPKATTDQGVERPEFAVCSKSTKAASCARLLKWYVISGTVLRPLMAEVILALVQRET